MADPATAPEDPFPLLHLADLEFTLDAIPTLHAYQLALAHLHPDYDPAYTLKVKQAWRKKREKARKDITAKVPMGAFSSIDEQQKEQSPFARFELVDLSFPVEAGAMEGLTSGQLAAIVFHPKATEELVEEASDIFFNRRERDFGLDLSPPSLEDAPPARPAARIEAAPKPAAEVPQPVQAPPVSAYTAPPPAALPGSRLPAHRAPPPPPPPAGLIAAPLSAGDDTSSLPFGLPGLSAPAKPKLESTAAVAGAEVKLHNGDESREHEKDKGLSLKEREKEAYRRSKVEEEAKSRERRRSEGSPSRDSRRERSREREHGREKERDVRRDDRDRPRRRSRSRSRSPTRTSLSSRRESYPQPQSQGHQQSPNSSSPRYDREKELRDELLKSSSSMSRKRSRASDEVKDRERERERERHREKERERDRERERDGRGRAASPARSEGSTRSHVRRRTEDDATRQRDHSRERARERDRERERERDRDRADRRRSPSPPRSSSSRTKTGYGPPPRDSMPPPQMPAPDSFIPMSLQQSLSVLFLRHFPPDTQDSDIAIFLSSIYPPNSPQSVPQPVGIKLASQKTVNINPGGPQIHMYAFVAFERADEARTVMAGMQSRGNGTKKMWKGMEVSASYGKDVNKPVWRWLNFPTSFVERCYQNQLAAFAALKAGPSSLGGPPAPPPPPSLLSDANGPLPSSPTANAHSRLPASLASRLSGLQEEKDKKGPAVNRELQDNIFGLRVENVPDHASLKEVREFFSEHEGLIGLALLPAHQLRDLRSSSVYLAFEGPKHKRINAKRSMAGIRFQGHRMKLWVEMEEDYARKSGERHDWLWSEMTKEYRNAHREAYERALAESGTAPLSPAVSRSGASVSSGYERDRNSNNASLSTDANGDVHMQDSYSHLQARPQLAVVAGYSPFSPATSVTPISALPTFDSPRRPGPVSSYPQSQPNSAQEYSPIQPGLGVSLPLSFPPRPQAAFLDGQYGTPWRPEGLSPAVQSPAAYAALASHPQAQALQHPLPAPPVAALQAIPSAALTPSANSGGIHPARLAMLNATAAHEPVLQDAGADEINMGGGDSAERLDAAEEKKMAEETQRNAWGRVRRASANGSVDLPASTLVPMFPTASSSSSTSSPQTRRQTSPPSNAPTGPRQLSVKGLARSPPSASSATLPSLSSSSSTSISPSKASFLPARPGSPSLASRTSALAQVCLPRLVEMQQYSPVVPNPNPSLLERLGEAVGNGGEALASNDPERQREVKEELQPSQSQAEGEDGLTAGQRLKLQEKARYAAEKARKLRQQSQQQQQEATAADGAQASVNGNNGSTEDPAPTANGAENVKKDDAGGSEEHGTA
ncbi:hypothetical protein JCM11641_006316 [Rhodosporidiobolus odoratus]